MTYSCTVPTTLAYFLIIYAMSNVLYLLFTRNIGTPFMDSLTKKQQNIRAESSRQRRQIFFVSLLASTFLVYWMKPFKSE